MDNDPILVSKRSITGALFVFIGSALFFFMSCLIVKDALRAEQTDSIKLLLGLFFAITSILFLYFFPYQTFILYKDRVEIVYIFGLAKKTILTNDIVSWCEHTGSKGKSTLTFFYGYSKCSFDNNGYSNYDELKKVITKEKREISSSGERLILMRVLRMFLVILSILFFALGIKNRPQIGLTF